MKLNCLRDIGWRPGRRTVLGKRGNFRTVPDPLALGKGDGESPSKLASYTPRGWCGGQSSHGPPRRKCCTVAASRPASAAGHARAWRCFHNEASYSSDRTSAPLPIFFLSSSHHCILFRLSFSKPSSVGSYH